MQGTLNLPWSTSTLVRILPVAKKQPLPTTSVSGSVTCREQKKFQITTRFHVFLIFVALGLFEETGSLGVIDYIYSFLVHYCGWT